jgi:hypothetical protein
MSLLNALPQLYFIPLDSRTLLSHPFSIRFFHPFLPFTFKKSPAAIDRWRSYVFKAIPQFIVVDGSTVAPIPSNPPIFVIFHRIFMIISPISTIYLEEITSGHGQVVVMRFYSYTLMKYVDGSTAA